MLVDAYAKLGDLEKAETWMRPIDEGTRAQALAPWDLVRNHSVREWQEWDSFH